MFYTFSKYIFPAFYEFLLYNLIDCVKRTDESPMSNYYANFNTQFIHEAIVCLNSKNVLKTDRLTMYYCLPSLIYIITCTYIDLLVLCD